MQSKNKFMDDMSQIMTNAMGVAQGAKDEAENAMKSFMDRWLADRNFVTREEFDAVRAMAQKARAQNEDLSARLEALEAAAAKKAPKSRRRPSPKQSRATAQHESRGRVTGSAAKRPSLGAAFVVLRLRPGDFAVLSTDK